MNIIYASDDNYVGLTAISAVSLLKHNPAANIFLLGYKLKDSAIDVVRSRVEKNDGAFHYIDVSPAIAKLEEIGADSYVSYAVYARIFIPDLLKDFTGRALYLDCDTLITGDVSALLEIDMHKRPLALAPDAAHPAYKRVIALPTDKTYYNTGVALMDLSVWRTSRCTERLMEELVHPHGRNPLGDQDIIVRTLNDEITPLPRKWNFLSQYFLQKLPDDAAIYHFSGHTLGRPWFTSSKHPLRNVYKQAAKEAELPEVADQVRPMAFEYRLQYWLYRVLPSFLFKPVCNLMYRTHIRITYGI